MQKRRFKQRRFFIQHKIIDSYLLFGHNKKAVTLSSGKEVLYGRNLFNLYRICHGKYISVLYLQMVRQIPVNHSGPNKKPGVAAPGFFAF